MSFLLPAAIKNPFGASASMNSKKTGYEEAQPACIAWLAIFRVRSDGSEVQNDGDLSAEVQIREQAASDANADIDASPTSNADLDLDEESDLDILFYFAKEMAVDRRQVRRQVGVLRGATDFYGSMLGADGTRRCFLHSQKHRNVVLAVENDIWIMGSFQAPRWPRSSARKLRWHYDEEWRPDALLADDLMTAWRIWTMLNGQVDFANGGLQARTSLERNLEKYFSVWASQWSFRRGPALESSLAAFQGLLQQHQDIPEAGGLVEVLGRRVTPEDDDESFFLQEFILVRDGRCVVHRSASGTLQASPEDVRILIAHALEFISTKRTRGPSPLVPSNTRHVKRSSSMMSLWQEKASRSGVAMRQASGPRTLPSLPVTSSAWFSWPKKVEPATAPLEASTHKDSEVVRRAPLMRLELAAWPQRYSDGTKATTSSRTVRILHHIDWIALLVFAPVSAVLPNTSPSQAESLSSLRGSIEDVLEKLPLNSEPGSRHLALKVSAGQCSGPPVELTHEARRVADGMAVLHQQTMNSGAAVAELMSRSSDGCAWLRSRRDGDSVSHVIVANGKLSMAEAEAETTRHRGA